LSERRRRASASDALDPWLDEMMIVVSRHEHDLARRAHRTPDRPQNRVSRGERVSHGTVAQFDHVPQQHQPVDVPNGGNQPLQGVVVTAEDVPPCAGPEMQVGNDERAQRGTG
jgi:hypothetical protein